MHLKIGIFWQIITDTILMHDNGQLQPNPVPFPRTFATTTTAFHLNIRADFAHSMTDKISTQYSIPNLLQATCDFLSHFIHDQNTCTITRKHGPVWNANVPFEDVRVWHSVQVQVHSQLYPGVAPPQKLFASPPSEEWPTERCDTAIFAQDATAGPLQPPPGLDSEWLHPTQPNLTEQQAEFFVGQICMVFHPI